MTRQQPQADEQTGNEKPAEKRDDGQQQTFETDISETGDDGTTVREAEVREDDLSEVKPPSGRRAEPMGATAQACRRVFSSVPLQIPPSIAVL